MEARPEVSEPSAPGSQSSPLTGPSTSTSIGSPLWMASPCSSLDSRVARHPGVRGINHRHQIDCNTIRTLLGKESGLSFKPKLKSHK